MQRIFLQFKYNDPQASKDWQHRCDVVFYNAQTNNLGKTETVKLEDLYIGENDELVVVIPSHECLVTQTNIAKNTPRKQLAQAIAFSLENELSDEIDNLHFAVGSVDDNKQQSLVSVAIINHSVLQGYLERFTNCNFQPSVIIPDCCLLDSANSSVLINEANACWNIINAAHQYISGGVRTLNLLPAAIIAAYQDLHKLQPHDDEADNDETTCPLHVYTNADQTEAVKQLDITINNKQIIIEHHIIESPIICWQANKYNQDKTHRDLQAINLLQGQYAPQNKNQEYVKRYSYLAAAITAAWLITWITGHFWQIMQLNNLNQQYKTQISKLYKQAFPKSQAVTSPRLRVQRQLKKLASDSSGSQLAFLTVIAKIGIVARSDPQTKINQARFQQDELKLSVVSENFNSLKKFTDALSKQQITVNRESATKSGDQVKAELVVK